MLVLYVLVAGSTLCASLALANRGSSLSVAMVVPIASPSRSFLGDVHRSLEAVGKTAIANRLASDRLKARLTLSGSQWSIRLVLGLRVVSLIVPPAICGLIFGPVTGLLLGLGLAVLLSLAPGFALARLVKRRRRVIEARVPDLVELLVATTESGLSPPIALRRSGQVMAGPLGEELARTVQKMDLGAPWREALQGMVERTDVPSLRRLVAALVRSHRLGTPVRQALRTIAEDLRAERSAAAQEHARRAPVQMLFPLVFLILPAFLLLTVGPVMLATIRSLHTG